MVTDRHLDRIDCAIDHIHDLCNGEGAQIPNTLNDFRVSLLPQQGSADTLSP